MQLDGGGTRSTWLAMQEKCWSVPRQVQHNQMKDIIWRSDNKAQYPAVKETVGLSKTDGERPDDAMMILWTRCKPLAWDVTIRDTFANSYISDMSVRVTDEQQLRLAERQQTKWQNTLNWSRFCAHRNRARWCLEWIGFRVQYRARKKNRRSHTGTKGATIPLPAVVHYFAERECCRIKEWI